MTVPSFETLELQVDGHVATVNLNRPEKANSLDATMWRELQACFEWLDEEPAVRAVVLTGNGTHFCAGHDLAMSGVVNMVYEDRETLLREVTAIAHNIASKSPLAVRGSKEMLLYSRDHPVAEGLNYIATWNAGMLSQADLQAGLQAQMEKKQASYEN